MSLRFPAPPRSPEAVAGGQDLPSWDLTDLYPEPDSKELEADFKRVEADAIAFATELRARPVVTPALNFPASRDSHPKMSGSCAAFFWLGPRSRQFSHKL